MVPGPRRSSRLSARAENTTQSQISNYSELPITRKRKTSSYRRPQTPTTETLASSTLSSVPKQRTRYRQTSPSPSLPSRVQPGERDPSTSLSNLEIGSTPNCVPTIGKSIPLVDGILQTACDHLIAVNPRLKPLIEKHACPIFSPDSLSTAVDSFESLCISIISQQVSGAAAAAIKSRFLALFDVTHGGDGASFPRPSDVSRIPIDTLRAIGFSQRKAEYVLGLADKFSSGDLSDQLLREASDAEVTEKLIAVRGLGKWSIDMFALFTLKRLDVFSAGDLGVQRGMAAFAGRNVSKLRNKTGKFKYMTEQEMQDIASPFAPYRSLFMWYMWQVEATDISVWG